MSKYLSILNNKNKPYFIIILLTLFLIYIIYNEYNNQNESLNDYKYTTNQSKTIIQKDTLLNIKFDTIIKKIPYQNQNYIFTPIKTKLKNNVYLKLDTIFNNDTIKIEYKEIDNLLRLDIKYHKDTFRVINKEIMEIRNIEEKTIETIMNYEDKIKPKDKNILENIETIITTLGLGFIIGILFN